MATLAHTPFSVEQTTFGATNLPIDICENNGVTVNNHLEIPAIHYRTYIKAPPPKVFAAISTAEGWNSWFTQASTGDFRLGGMITLRWQNWGVDHESLVTESVIPDFEPNHKFSFYWAAGTKNSKVTFQLDAHGDGTIVTVTDSGHGATQHDLEVVVSCACGWGEALTLLKFYLEYGITYGTD